MYYDHDKISAKGPPRGLAATHLRAGGNMLARAEYAGASDTLNGGGVSADVNTSLEPSLALRTFYVMITVYPSKSLTMLT